MATYFVNANGSETSPFDTELKGANTLKYLVDNAPGGLQSGDIVEVTDDAVIDDSGSSVSIPGLILRSHSGNTSKPTIKVSNSQKLLEFTSNGTSPTVQSIKFYKDGPSASNGFLDFEAQAFSNIEVSNCEFKVNDPSSINANCQALFLKFGISVSGTATIKKNKFDNVYNGIHYYNVGGGPS